MLRLRKFMFDNVYLGPEAQREHGRVERAMRGLFDHYVENPDGLPRWDPSASDCQRVADYIAGMTDRYCIAKFTELTIPEESRF
jgi:dGTPase